MLTEAEILVHLSFRVKGHACKLYTGFHRGLNRNQRRRICRDEWARERGRMRMYGYHFSVARTVLWFSDEYIRTKTWEYLKKAFGEALYIAPMGFLVAAKPKAKLNTLVKRGYLPVWYLENIQCMRGPAWMIPLPLRGQRKMCRWQLPPRGKKFKQSSDGGGNSITAINLFPEEWIPKDAYDIVDES